MMAYPDKIIDEDENGNEIWHFIKVKMFVGATDEQTVYTLAREKRIESYKINWFFAESVKKYLSKKGKLKIPRSTNPRALVKQISKAGNSLLFEFKSEPDLLSFLQEVSKKCGHLTMVRNG